MEGYKARLVEEYKQLADRTKKLSEIIRRHRDGELDFELNCPIDLLVRQLGIMSSYKAILETRADVEGIDLKGEN